MTNELFSKYIWLVDTIYRSKKITFNELNNRWLRSNLSGGVPLPLRTFHNWRSAIEDIFDININCNRKGGYYYYIEDDESLQKGGVRSWLLNTFAVNNLMNENLQMRNRILFEDIPSGREFLVPILDAMRDGVELQICYKSYWHEEALIYTIQPYCVKIFKQRWYVVGYCHERDAIRIFSLDRISELILLMTKFEVPAAFCPTDYFLNSFGITVEDVPVETVRIKVYGVNVLYFRALPIHYSQKEIETYNDYSLFEYKMQITYDFKQELLSRGANIEVVEPASLRQDMIDQLEAMRNRY